MLAEFINHPLIPRLVAALLWALAWAGLFLGFYNRILSLLNNRLVKAVLLPGSGGLVLVAAMKIGYLTGWSAWLVLPGLVLVGLCVGSLWNLHQRAKLVGSPPIAGSNQPICLSKMVTTQDLGIHFYQVEIPTWAGSRLRVAHLSDLHVNRRLDAGYFRAAVERVNATYPDLVFITGDFVSELAYIDRLPSILSHIQARLGIYGILGNHDYWAGAELIAQTVSACGVQLLSDQCLRPSGSGPGGLLLCGCEAPWAPGEPPLPPDSLPGELLLVLSHTADYIYHYSRVGAGAVFSGHYHAGQICLPWIGPVVVPSRYGRRFDHGHFVVGETHLFVTAGLGAAEPPVRIYCPPDIFIVDLLGASPGGGDRTE